jgi:hypothetical protein
MLIKFGTATQTVVKHTDLSIHACYLSCIQSICRVTARFSNSLRTPFNRVNGLVVVAQCCGHTSNEGCRPYASCTKKIGKAKDSDFRNLMHAENG